ncbi:hypothetical protein AVEN_129912-1 [Araneus ventricosus]|uniref:Uncharacterized protein n=1 Tax=Araneus ventricosus TaxID=182803 RepID=A0A4Y2JQF3_ARAVE|nr:hypothetical protein AVEN_129912-1 [Araneus ventricosus]
MTGVAGCCWHGDTPWGNKLALVGLHLGSGWIFTGRTTLHGDFGFLNLLDITPFSSCKWIPSQGYLVCGGQPFISLLSGDWALQAVAPDGFCAPGFIVGQQGHSSDF